VPPFGSAFHVAFRVNCISPNTPEAITRSVMTPKTLAKIPEGLPEALLMICSSSAGLVTSLRACGPAGGSVATGMKKISYRGYRFPPGIIQQAIWLYLRFTLSFRDVEDLLAERGISLLRDHSALGESFRALDRGGPAQT
jgi:hypothetical protein